MVDMQTLTKVLLSSLRTQADPTNVMENGLSS